jgi:hypothetical protein
MFNKVTVEQNLSGLVGLRQPYNPDYAILDTDNQNSRSGYFANDNPMAKLELVFDNSDYVDMSNADKNESILRMQRSAISYVCSQIFDNVDFINRQFTYKNPLNKVNVETLETGFVGYKITKSCENNVAFKITRMLLNFQGTGSIKLLLFNATKTAVLKSQVINITSVDQVVDLNWEINSEDFGNEFYIGYLTTGLTVAPFKRDYQNSSIISNYTHISFNQAIVIDHNVETIFDLTKAEGSSNSFGLNFDVTEYYDYTELITNNQALFAYAICLQYTINILQSCIGSIRSNKHERMSNDILFRTVAEIDGIDGDNSAVRKVGLKSLLLSEIKSIKKEINKLKSGYFGGPIKVITLS